MHHILSQWYFGELIESLVLMLYLLSDSGRDPMLSEPYGMLAEWFAVNAVRFYSSISFVTSPCTLSS